MLWPIHTCSLPLHGVTLLCHFFFKGLILLGYNVLQLCLGHANLLAHKPCGTLYLLPKQPSRLVLQSCALCQESSPKLCALAHQCGPLACKACGALAQPCLLSKQVCLLHPHPGLLTK